MRFRSFGAIGGAIGIATLAAASSDGDLTTCAASPSTVFLTVQSVVTIHDAPTSTVYVNMSELPFTTLTSIKTTTSTTQARVITTVSNAATPVNTPVYEATVTKTVYATISDGQVVPAKSGPLVTSSKTTASGPYGYIVNNGTTYWVDGQTPASAAVYVVETSVLTVVPIPSVPTTSEDETSTLTFQTTVFLTRPLTITETEVLITSTSPWNIHPTASVGTGVLGFSMAPGGWNVSGPTSAAAGVIVSTSGSHSSSASKISISYSSIGILNPSNGVIPSLTSLSAAMGFPSQSSSPSSFTTAVPYVNKSSITFASSTLGVLTPLTFISFTESTITSSRSISAIHTSSALGVLTTLSSTCCTENSTTPTFSSSSAFDTSSKISALTTLSSTLHTQNTTGTTFSSISVLVTSSAVGTFRSITSTLCSENATTTTLEPKPSVSLSISVSVNSIASSRASTASPSSVTTSMPSSTSVSVPVSSTTSVQSSTSSVFGVLSSSSSGLPTTVPVSAASSTIPPFSSGSASSYSLTGISTTTSVPVSTGLFSFNTSRTSSLPTTLLTSVTSSSIYSPLSSSQPTTTTWSSASTSVSASATPTTCGEVGDFTLNFDDIPPLSVNNQSESTIQPAPVFNPYHQFYFSDGFVVVPPPTDPYLPSSPKQLLEFIPNFNSNGTNPAVGPNTLEFGYSGDVGNADHGAIGCFSFNAYGASFGCDSTGPDCDFSFTGFRYNSTSGQTLPVTQQSIAVPACPALKNCELEPIVLLPAFSDLDSLRINVTVAGQPKIWWMDDLALGWYNNTCMAGLCRQNAHIP